MISTKTNSKKEIQNLMLPSNYSKDLAEETGIHIGDGCMNMYSSRTNVYVYSGHAIDDLEFSKHVKDLMKRLYNLKPSNERVQKTTIMLRYTRKELVQFKQSLGLPMGYKNNIKIPSWIMKNNNFKISCIKGIFATDGSLVFQKKYREIGYYPRLSIISKSEILINQINEILNNLGIRATVYCDKRVVPRHPNRTYYVYIYGKKNLFKYTKIIGFSNPKHIKKYQEWKNSAGGET